MSARTWLWDRFAYAVYDTACAVDDAARWVRGRWKR